MGAVTDDEPGPIVFLLGCRTAEEEITSGSLVSAFRRAKASVVLGTLDTVRGRHMAPVARAAVEHVLAHARGPGVRFGEMVTCGATSFSVDCLWGWRSCHSERSTGRLEDTHDSYRTSAPRPFGDSILVEYGSAGMSGAS